MRFLSHKDQFCCICADLTVAHYYGFGWCQVHLERAHAIVRDAEHPRAARQLRLHWVARRTSARKRSMAQRDHRRAQLLVILAEQPHGVTAMEITQQFRIAMRTLLVDLRQLRLLGKVARVYEHNRVGRGRRRMLWQFIAPAQRKQVA